MYLKEDLEPWRGRLICSLDMYLVCLNTYLDLTAPIAQLVERPLSEREVVGSNPDRTIKCVKGVKNGPSTSLAGARIKGVVLGR